jgi:hypothetical protein
MEDMPEKRQLCASVESIGRKDHRFGEALKHDEKSSTFKVGFLYPPPLG